jgi:hypothetical protein
MCVYYRALNEVTIENKYHCLGLMIHLVNFVVLVCSLIRIGSAKDIKCDLLKSTFILMNGLYKYMAMYFGLTKALNYYMDLMNKDFIEYLDKFIIVFIDGILVYSKSEDEHLRLVS